MAVFRTTARITHSSIGGVGVNTWHLRTADEDINTESDLETLIGYIEDFYTGLGVNTFADDTTISMDGVCVQVGVEEPTVRDVTGWTLENVGAGAPLPPATAFCITWRSMVATRSGRGRTFINPLSTGILQDNGTPTESARDNFRAVTNALIEASDTFANGAIGVWSPTQNVLRDFVGATIPNEFAVLRSRRD